MFVLFALLSLSLGAPGPERPLDEASIQRLVEAARRGDREALGRLYTEHVARVFRAVRAMCRNDAEAEDVTHESFAKAFAALDRYEPKAGARFVSWLLTIAQNTARKRGKQQSRSVSVEPETLAELGGVSEGVEAELGALRTALLAGLADLDERDRWVMCLRYGGDLEAAEVAEITGLSQANVRKICERQRKRLLEHLKQRGFASDETAEPSP